MSTANARPLRTDTCLRLSYEDWKTYTRLLHIFAVRPGVRLTYDRGELEIMSPLRELDNDAWFLGRAVFVLTEEFGLPLRGSGSTMLRRRVLERGIEADECFWIANVHRMKGRRRLDLRRDPPPDLAIDVDMRVSSMDRLGIYAALRVPEVWRLDGKDFTFHILKTNHKYAVAQRSLSFPPFGPADLLPYIKRARKAGDVHPVIRDFRALIRDKIKGKSKK